MPIVLLLCSSVVYSLFKSRRRLILENLALRQQVAMLKQSVRRPRATVADKLFWIFLSRYAEKWRDLLHALHPDTVVRWHREGLSYGQIWCMTNSSSGDRIFCFTLLDFNPVSELHTLNDFGQIVKAA